MSRRNTNRFLNSALQTFPRATVCSRWFSRCKKKFEALQIKSNRDIVAQYGILQAREKFVAITILMQNRFRAALPLLFSELILQR